MACSRSTTNVSRNHVDTSVPQLIADLFSSNLIEALVELVGLASVNGGGMMGNLPIAFARIGRPQFVEAFEVVRMEDLPCRADDLPLKIEIAFVRRK